MDRLERPILRMLSKAPTSLLHSCVVDPKRSVPQTPPTEWADGPAEPALSAPELISGFGIFPIRQQFVVLLLRPRRTDQIHAIKACWRGNHVWFSDGIILVLYTLRAMMSVRHPTYDNS